MSPGFWGGVAAGAKRALPPTFGVPENKILKLILKLILGFPFFADINFLPKTLDTLLPTSYTIPMTATTKTKSTITIDFSTNPLRIAREATGLSQGRLAELLGVSRHFILRVEQGLYEDVPPAVGNFFSNPDLIYEYHRWQNTRRRLSAEDKDLALNDNFFNFHYRGYRHPLIAWRSENANLIARMTFCRAYCLQPAIVERFERGKTASVPGPVANGLGKVYPNAVSGIEYAYLTWREHQNKPSEKTAKTAWPMPKATWPPEQLPKPGDYRDANFTGRAG